jgi:hypothetical protein
MKGNYILTRGHAYMFNKTGSRVSLRHSLGTTKWIGNNKTDEKYTVSYSTALIEHCGVFRRCTSRIVDEAD